MNDFDLYLVNIKTCVQKFKYGLHAFHIIIDRWR